MLQVDHIVKCYTDVPVVKGITFEIRQNGVYGFLGPNGAGKSTTMNIITGCLSATGGTVKVGGFDILEEPEKAKRLIGYLPEQPPLYLDMSPEEYLYFVAAARGVKKHAKAQEVSHALEVTGLTPVRRRLMKHLSKGYRQRVGISQTLLGNPAIIILDEPTVGLDPKQIADIRELVKSLGKEHIVLFSSHIMQEVQAISDRIMIIARGQLLVSCRPEELEETLHKTPVIRLRVRAEKVTALDLAQVPSCIGKPEFLSYQNGISEITVETEDPDRAAEQLFFAFAGHQIPILRMEPRAISLEEAFLELTADLDTYGEEAAAPADI